MEVDYVVLRAEAFADGAHRAMQQRRKVTNQPYIVHPREVAQMVKAVGLPSYVVAAALLHDVLEDTGVSFQDLVDVFGPYVAKLVDEVTNITVPEDGCRAVRASIERAHLRRASPEAQSIKLADISANLRYVEHLETSFAKVYVAEKELLVPELTRGHDSLRASAQRQLECAINYVKELS